MKEIGQKAPVIKPFSWREGEFEDGFRGIILERRALIKDSFERLRAEHPLLPTELREFQVLHTADILLGSDTFDIILNFRLM